MSDALKDELLNDPLVRGYSTMSDQEASDDLNIVNRERNRTSMSASEILNAVDAVEYADLTNAEETQFWNLMGIGTLNPFGVEAALMTGWFGGAGSVTISALQAARKEDVSRAEELPGVRSPMKSGYVEEARRV